MRDLSMRQTLMTDITTGETQRISFVLRVERGTRVGDTIAVERNTVVLGSASDVDFAISDARVSRRHASFACVDDGVRVTDLNSKNGTHIDGIRVHEAVLRPGARITIGDTTLLLVGKGQTIKSRSAKAKLGALQTHSAAFAPVVAIAKKAAASDVTVLLLGESGVGKEVVAQALHGESPRQHQPFVVVDCGALSPGLVASELFGHKRGAFTSASEDRMGAFEAAKGGTVFLDEIGELPLDLQPHLLRVLDRRQVTRVGESHPRPIDVRIVAATNRDLKADVAAGRFRQDLFYRLAVVALQIPPLRERTDELLDLAERFLHEHGRTLPELADSDRRALLSHPFAGNVRELKNLIARSCALSRGDTLRLAFEHAGDGAVRASPAFMPISTANARMGLPLAEARAQVLAEFDAAYLQQVLSETRFNVSAAARRAGIARSHLHRLLERHPQLRREARE